jgi:peptide chain release factor 1
MWGLPDHFTGICMLNRLDSLVQRFNELEDLLTHPDVVSDIGKLASLGKERANLINIVQAYQKFQRAGREVQEAQEIVESDDSELAALAKDELPQLLEKRDTFETELKRALIPRDPNNERNVIVEIRAGTGGGEASLFAADLYRMYMRFVQRKGWKMEVVNTSEGIQGGLKEIIFEVVGRGAYQRFKHESGVHRVQRVPLTEAQGRIHTSTATVAVLPQAEEIDVQIKSDELRIDIFHSGGPGGQNVNKVATAVRMVHLPTGIVAICQDERSQLKNRQKAMTLLRSRLLEREILLQATETSAARKQQVGTGERSEKIRTYNFPQDRLTDHRIGLTIHGLDAIFDGEIDSIIEVLIQEEQTRLIQQAVA